WLKATALSVDIAIGRLEGNWSWPASHSALKPAESSRTLTVAGLSPLSIVRRTPSEATPNIRPGQAASSSVRVKSQAPPVRSSLVVTTRVPHPSADTPGEVVHGLKAIDLTASLWPSRVSSLSPVTAFQIVAVPFWLAVARRWPSGLKVI